MQQILTYIFLIIYSVTILGIILVVITDNRNPLKTLPWIIVLVLAPVVGLIFYFSSARTSPNSASSRAGRASASPCSSKKPSTPTVPTCPKRTARWPPC